MDNDENKKDRKTVWLDCAEVVDRFRLIPRAILGAYGYLVYKTAEWYMLLPEPSTQQVTFVSTVVGAAAVVIGLYNNSGKKYD